MNIALTKKKVFLDHSKVSVSISIVRFEQI